MNTKRKIKIVIADDHPIVRKGLVQIISESNYIEVIGEADDGNELMDIVRSKDVDVVLLDIAMPQKSGWDAMLRLKTEYPDLPVIILSVFPEEEYGVQFFKAGASGYLAKNSSPNDLVKAIDTVVQGNLYVSPGLAQKLASNLLEHSEKPRHELLSPREFQILCMIASGKTVKVIADELSLSTPTISTYRSRILNKMNLKTNSELTNYAFKNKLL